MGRILRKKPTTLKKKKRPEDGDPVDAADPSADADRAVETADEDAEAKRRLTPVVRKPQPAPVGAPAAPPADNAFTRSLQFLREVKIELKKVTWPSRQQTLGSTLVVIVLVMIISLFLGLADLGLSTVIRSLFR
jgi:preprotein translocase subunit SecE